MKIRGEKHGASRLYLDWDEFFMFRDYQQTIYCPWSLAHVYVNEKATKNAKVDYHYCAIRKKTGKNS